MTIGIITANFGRLPILEIFCAGIKRLREETGFNIPCVSVGDADGGEILAKYSIAFVEYPNTPLTAKFNRACTELQSKCDYVLIMGSDNLISTATFLRIYAECEKGIDLIGFSDVYFYGLDDVSTGKLIHFPHTQVLGVARTISARVLDKVNWMPWGRPADRGIDKIMLETIEPHVTTRTLLDGGFVVDMKTSFNLNPIRFWLKRLGAMPSDEKFWVSIGEEERRLVKEYIENH